MLVRPTQLVFVRPCSTRGFATDKQLKARIKAVRNIKKITSAMKMVAAAKLRGSQRSLEVARSFYNGISGAFPKITEDVPVTKRMWVGVSADKGLCGSINGSIVRAIRDDINEKAQNVPDKSILLYGLKGAQGLERQFGRYITVGLSELGRYKPSFRQVATLTDYMIKNMANVERADFFYQYFKNSIAYVTTRDIVYSWPIVQKETKKHFYKYELEGEEDILQNLYEYQLACKVFYFIAETDTSTLSARMTAMENSSKSATEMIDKLNLYLNRARQGKITTELVEIISGAIASEDTAAQR